MRVERIIVVVYGVELLDKRLRNKGVRDRKEETKKNHREREWGRKEKITESKERAPINRCSRRRHHMEGPTRSKHPRKCTSFPADERCKMLADTMKQRTWSPLLPARAMSTFIAAFIGLREERVNPPGVGMHSYRTRPEPSWSSRPGQACSQDSVLAQGCLSILPGWYN